MTARRLLLSMVVLAALASAAAACGGEEVSFGEGDIPSPVPGDFPVPDGAEVGSTLVDRVNNRTEFRLNIPDGAGAVVRFFTVGLVNAGYVVESSEGDAAAWSIHFARETLRGTILIESAGPEVTSAVVSINRS